jgi:hypothetical protein
MRASFEEVQPASLEFSLAWSLAEAEKEEHRSACASSVLWSTLMISFSCPPRAPRVTPAKEAVLAAITRPRPRTTVTTTATKTTLSSTSASAARAV